MSTSDRREIIGSAIVLIGLVLVALLAYAAAYSTGL